MSKEQIRAQRAYIEAADLEREAGDKIKNLKEELERWERIRHDARQLGANALTNTTGETDQVATQPTDIPEQA